MSVLVSGHRSFTVQVLAWLNLFAYWKEAAACENDVYSLPKQLDEPVATLHLPALGGFSTLPMFLHEPGCVFIC